MLLKLNYHCVNRASARRHGQRVLRQHLCCARLEAALEELKSAASDSTDRHLLEYLFLPGSPEQLQQLAEEGFPQPPPWLLTNSLRLALEGHLKPGQSSHVLIAKVLMTRGCKVRCKGQGSTLSFETCPHRTRCWKSVKPCSEHES